MESKHKKTIAKAKLSFEKMASGLKTPAAVVVGMIGGKLAGDAIDSMLNKTSTVAGLGAVGTIGTYAKPVLLVVAGLAAKQLVKNEFVQNMGIGVAAFGVATGVKSVINIPQLSQITGGSTPTPTPAVTATNGFGYIPRPVLPAGSPARLLKKAVIL